MKNFNTSILFILSLIDYNVDIKNNFYCYKLIAEDNCGNLSLDSAYSCTILLNGKCFRFRKYAFMV